MSAVTPATELTLAQAGSFHVLIHLILVTVLCALLLSHSTEEKTDWQRGQMACQGHAAQIQSQAHLLQRLCYHIDVSKDERPEEDSVVMWGKKGRQEFNVG